MDALLSNPSAVEVVKAFGLVPKLLQPDVLLSALSEERAGKRPSLLNVIWIEFKRPLEDMIECAKPLKALVVPKGMQGNGIANDEVLTVNLTRETLDLPVVRKTLSDLESLYDAVNRISGIGAHSPLEILKIESGTNLSISLKGMGEPIKQIKELIVELWTKHRQKRVDEILDHHRVIASGIRLIDDIEKNVKKKSLTAEDGARLKRSVLKDAFSLFGNGALIDEIPTIEKVNNVALLGAFGPKLLSAPLESDGAEPKADYLTYAGRPDLLPESFFDDGLRVSEMAFKPKKTRVVAKKTRVAVKKTRVAPEKKPR
jgi:hypothetical protein